MQIVKLKTLTLLFLLLIIAGVATGKTPATTQPAGAALSQKRDRVIATKNLTGRLKGFEVGDYAHAVIKLQNGKEKSFFIGGIGVDYFLALHKDEDVVVTYQIVDSYIPEAGGKMRIERISSVKAGGLTSSAWWKQARAKSSQANLDKKYGKLVENLRLNP